MQTGLKANIVKHVANKSKCLDGEIQSYTLRRIKEGEIADDEVYVINLVNLTKGKLIELLKYLKEAKAPTKNINTVEAWIKNIENPHDAIITSLNHFEKTLTAAIKETSPHWVMMKNDDGIYVPYAVNEVKYNGRTRYNDEPYVHINLKYAGIKVSHRWNDDDIDDLLKVEVQSEHCSIYNDDLFKAKSTPIKNDFTKNKADDEEEDFDEEDTTKKKKMPAKGDFKLTEILSKQGIMLLSEKDYNEYRDQSIALEKISKEIGVVYTCNGVGMSIEDRANGYQRWKIINDEDKIARLVIDTPKEKETPSPIDFNGNAVEIPIHPYQILYNLSSYSYVYIHVTNLTKYVFDKKLIDKLVINDKKKRLLSAIISDRNNFSDIIQGKSGGIIILGTGGPGLGKTLTAEVYSEIMEKPLYSIQSSQLGIDIDTIEKNLNKILYRADKWKAVLLIDKGEDLVYQTASGKMIYWHTYRQWAHLTTNARNTLIQELHFDSEDPIVLCTTQCRLCKKVFMPNMFE